MSELKPIGRLTSLAASKGRDYVTPDDVREVLAGNGYDTVYVLWLELLFLIAGDAEGWAIRDVGECAHAATRPWTRS